VRGFPLLLYFLLLYSLAQRGVRGFPLLLYFLLLYSLAQRGVRGFSLLLYLQLFYPLAQCGGRKEILSHLQSHLPLSPAPGTPGEGWGGGLSPLFEQHAIARYLPSPGTPGEPSLSSSGSFGTMGGGPRLSHAFSSDCTRCSSLRITSIFPKKPHHLCQRISGASIGTETPANCGTIRGV
jgi:hypothetical protein